MNVLETVKGQIDDHKKLIDWLATIVLPILLLLALLVLPGCVSTPEIKPVVYEQTKSTRMLVIAYIGDDETYVKRVEAPLAALSYLAAEAEQLNGGLELVKFFEAPENAWYIEQSVDAYVEIKTALIEYHQQYSKPFPAILVDYDRDVLSAYHSIMKAIKEKDRRKRLSELASMLLKMVAVKNGILL